MFGKPGTLSVLFLEGAKKEESETTEDLNLLQVRTGEYSGQNNLLPLFTQLPYWSGFLDLNSRFATYLIQTISWQLLK